jgi:putative tryptophan/tyrosine transport system substrate-binding protein
MTARRLHPIKVASALLTICALLGQQARADSPPAIARIGVLMPPLATAPEEGKRQGLRELGYVEAKNLVIEWRRSTGSLEDLHALAADLAQANVQVIVTPGAPGTRAALEATHLPVVFAPVGDAVANGFAASLARPGGKATGITAESNQLSAKRLELLKAAVPKARRIIYLMNTSSPVERQHVEAIKQAARTLRVELLAIDARDESELDRALRTSARSDAGGILLPADLLLLANKARIAAAIRKARLPAMAALREYQEDGVLMSYGIDLKESMRRAAAYVDKILRGAKPAELPVEQVSKFDLVIDLRAARELGIHVPQELLLRAEEVLQ